MQNHLTDLSYLNNLLSSNNFAVLKPHSMRIKCKRKSYRTPQPFSVGFYTLVTDDMSSWICMNIIFLPILCLLSSNTLKYSFFHFVTCKKECGLKWVWFSRVKMSMASISKWLKPGSKWCFEMYTCDFVEMLLTVCVSPGFIKLYCTVSICVKKKI